MKFKGKRSMIFLSAVLLFLFAITPLFADQYVISADFDLIEGVSGGMHTIRIYALTSGSTNIGIVSAAPFTGAPDLTAVLADAGEYGEWELPAGAIINADQAVLVIKYDAAGYALNSSLVGNDYAMLVSSGDFFIVAASEDATNVSVDLDNDGIADDMNINSGYAVIGSVGSGKSVTASGLITVLSLDTGSQEIPGVYLLTPGSSAYAPLVPNSAPVVEDDIS
jgi:hypothetical protein